MTETDTRDLVTLLFVAAATLLPIGLLAAIAGVGGTPHGAAIAWFALPTAFLVAALALGARLTARH